jgi:flavin-dependent dehydrogenase
MKTINIIGAGPIGSYLAYLLARKKQQVHVYEEHKTIGKPVQCAGIVTSSIFDSIDFSINPCIKNKIKKIEINSKNYSVEFNIRRPDLIIDREKFDKLIYNKAKKSGAKFYLGKKLISVNEREGHLISFIKSNNKIKEIPTNIVVGADGPLSLVARKINKTQKIIPAIQARVRTKKTPDKNKIIIYLKSKTFVWIIPKNELKKYIKGKVLEWQSGIVPCYDKFVHKGNIYLVGDAAGQIKETTYGGIVPGLRGANALAKSILENKNYNFELKKVSRELWIHHKIRNFLNKFSEKDYDLLLKLVKQDKIKKILENTDRDNMKKSMIKIFILEPRFLYFFFLFFAVRKGPPLR